MEKAIRRAKKEGKIAKTAQQTIPYEEMYPDGICRITNRLYSKSVLCDDINYAEASDDEKAVLFELYCKLVNYFGPSVGFELSVICYPADLVEYRKMLALNPQGDQFDEIRKEYSDMLVRQVSKSRYERRICLTYTIEADGIRQARSRLEQIDNDVVGHFRALTVAAHPMDGYERLTILHRCLHLEENRKFRFNWDSLKHTGLSSKDYIAPSSFFFKDGRYFRSGASFGAVSFLQIRATKLYDTLLNSILNMEGSQIVSIHAKALDQNAALKAVKRKLSDLDKAKIDEQKRAVRSGFDMDILPPDLVTFGKEAQKLLEDLQNHDEKMFMVTILVVHAASSRQKLENLIYSANGITNTQNCDLIRLDYQQEQGFVSALPIGINQVEIQRGLTTSGTAIFLPFRACEVFQPKGVYYGLNATTNRMILADRKTLKCPNGVVLGTPGSGKSFSCKREAADVYLHKPELSTLLRANTWSNNLHIMSKTKTDEERAFYLKLASKEKYKARELERQIDSGYYERLLLSDGKAPSGIDHTENTGMIRDLYMLEFLNLPEPYKEFDLKQAILKNMKQFLLEFGRDFIFMGEEYHLQVGKNDYFVDLLFYHRELQCLVAIDLKIDDFKPEYLGKMEFYLEALDRDIRKPHENPSVGIILCKSKDEDVVEYALSRNMSSTMISEYRTKLISKEILQKKLEELYDAADESQNSQQC